MAWPQYQTSYLQCRYGCSLTQQRSVRERNGATSRSIIISTAEHTVHYATVTYCSWRILYSIHIHTALHAVTYCCISEFICRKLSRSSPSHQLIINGGPNLCCETFIRLQTILYTLWYSIHLSHKYQLSFKLSSIWNWNMESLFICLLKYKQFLSIE